MPLRLTTGIDSTFVGPAYQMALTMIKHIIKNIIRSTTLNIIIPKHLETFKFRNIIKTRPQHQFGNIPNQ